MICKWKPHIQIIKNEGTMALSIAAIVGIWQCHDGWNDVKRTSRFKWVCNMVGYLSFAVFNLVLYYFLFHKSWEERSLIIVITFI